MSWEFGKGLCYQEGEDDGGLCVHLDGLCVHFDLAPTDSFVWASSGIRAVILLTRVDEHGEIGTVAHEVGVANVVLDQTSA